MPTITKTLRFNIPLNPSPDLFFILSPPVDIRSWKTHNLHTTVQRSRVSKIVSCFWKKSVMLNTFSGMRRRSRRSHSFDLYLCSYKRAVVSSYFAILRLFLTILTFFSELQETKYELWHTLSVLQEKCNNYEKQSSIFFLWQKRAFIAH